MKKNNKQKLLPFNLEEALKNPERVVFQGGYISPEWKYFEKSKKIITLYQGINLTHNLEGKCLNQTSSLKLLPLPDKITKTYQTIFISSNYYNELYIGDNIYDSLEEAIQDNEDLEYIKAIQETTYNKTTGEISIKIVHKH